MQLDDLVVQLKLDSSNFTAGQREALASFKKTDDEMQKRLKNLELQNKNVGYSFQGAAAAAATGFATVLLGAGVVAFAKDAIDAAAGVGRLAQVTGIAGQEMSAFGKMIQNNGGSAAAATESLHSLAKAMQNLKWGQVSDDFLMGFSQLQAATPSLGMNSTPKDLAFALGKFADTHTAQEVEQVANRIGLSIDVVYEALHGSTRMAADFKEAMTNALSPDQIVKMQATQRSINDLEQSIRALATAAVSTAAPGLKELADKLTPLAQNPLAAIRADAQKDVEAARAAGQFDPVSSAILWALGPPNAPNRPHDVAGVAPGVRDSAEVREARIRSFAKMLGVDPDIAMKVTGAEGFKDYVGDNGTSFGDFQLHLTPGGRGHAVGDEFVRQTGLDPRDPRNEGAMDFFALMNAARDGWHDFHGAARVGVGDHEGISVTIGDINITTASKDPREHGRLVADEIRRQTNTAIAAQANAGLSN